MAREAVIKIVPMDISHLAQVQRIEKSSFATPWSYDAFISELTNNDNAYYLVAIADNDFVVGYVGVWIILDEGHITNIAVEPDYRGQGIGQALLKAITKYAKSQGVCRMTLEVRLSNTVAQHVYSKMGYKSSGIRPGYYRDNNEDALIMWKELVDDEQ